LIHAPAQTFIQNLLPGINPTILGFPPLWAPAAVRDAVLDAPIQRTAISASLATRDTPDDLQSRQVHCFLFNPAVDYKAGLVGLAHLLPSSFAF